MAMKLFGFQLSRQRKDSDSNGGDDRLKSFVAPNVEDGAASIEIAPSGFYASTLNLDGSIRDDISQIQQYRAMALHSEIESAVDDIINESIVTEEGTPTVKIVLDELDVSDKLKDVIRSEFDNILQMLDFNNRGYEIFRRWYVDGRVFYHKIIDTKNPRRGITELRYIDPTKIKKVREVKKSLDKKLIIKEIFS